MNTKLNRAVRFLVALRKKQEVKLKHQCTEAFKVAKQRVHKTTASEECDFIVEIHPRQLADKGYFKFNLD